MTHFLLRTVLVSAAASLAAACTSYAPFEGDVSVATPTYPTRLPPGSSTPPPQAPAQPISPDARPTTPVQSSALPPAAPSNQPGYVTPSTPPDTGPPQQPTPPRTYPAPTPYNPLPQPPPRSAAPPPQAAPPPVMQTVTRTSVSGRVVDAEGRARTYTVGKGDNLDAIARKLDTSRKDLAENNKLKEPYRLQPGQVLKGPVSKAKAYVVGSGDTLYAIARRFSVTAQALADENDIKIGASVRVGQRLRLPQGFKDKGPTTTTTQVAVAQPRQPTPPRQPEFLPNPPERTRPSTTPAPVTPATPSRPLPYSPPPRATPPSRTTAPSIIPSAPQATDSQISQLGRGRFVWPLRGEVISAFGPKGVGQSNDGVNIRANTGDVVRAAADGEVAYAGDQVPGFGNLVLVKHADGWVTAYGHLSRVDVKIQAKVAQGAQLGLAGSSGGVGEPQLHFEVRYAPTAAERARPVDPGLVLPQ